MTFVLSSLRNVHDYIFYDLADERTKDWFMCGSPWAWLVIVIVYHNFVYKYGPAFMNNRKPYNLNRIIQVYNIAQVLLCSWFVIESIVHFYGPTGAYSFSCEPIDHSGSPLAMKAALLGWGYFMMKLLDLLDTVFFVLRKKMSQVTFLHVYHHMGMVLLSWFGATYLPGGQGFFLVSINSFVHAVMYVYYFLSNYDPQYRKALWWKKHLTQLQMLQFLLIFIQFGRVLFNPECTYPRWPIYIFLPQDFVILYLFARFYKKAYMTPRTETPQREKSA